MCSEASVRTRCQGCAVWRADAKKARYHWAPDRPRPLGRVPSLLFIAKRTTSGTDRQTRSSENDALTAEMIESE
jgi:hypothetical protein